MASVWSEGHTVLFGVAAVAALCTAFYMSRLLFLTFFGKQRWSEGTHPHPSPAVMVLPMAVLAVAAILGAVLNLPGELPRAAMLDHFLGPVVGEAAHEEAAGVLIVMWALAAVGVLAAWWIYGVDLERREAVRKRIGPLNTLVRQKFFVDEIYATVFVAPVRLLASFLAGVFDRRVIDGAVNGVGTLVNRAAGSLRGVQTGFVRNYAVGVFGGAALIILYVVLRAG
jgi:NADH-quinone oxidoreductase subunit L